MPGFRAEHVRWLFLPSTHTGDRHPVVMGTQVLGQDTTTNTHNTLTSRTTTQKERPDVLRRQHQVFELLVRGMASTRRAGIVQPEMWR